MVVLAAEVISIRIPDRICVIRVCHQHLMEHGRKVRKFPT